MYAELQAISNFSFLRGGSHAAELVQRAAMLGLAALGIADRHSLAGAVRAHVAAKDAGLRLLVGARVETREGHALLLYPEDRAAYGRLSRLLTCGNRRARKGDCELHLTDLADHAAGQIAIALPARRPHSAAFRRRLAELAELYPRRCYLAASATLRGDDAERLALLAAIARRQRLPLVATNDVHYHVPERRVLQDVLTAIRCGCTVEQAGYRLFANAERHLKSPAEMMRLFREHPQAIAHTLEIVARTGFSLAELQYVYPIETHDGRTPQQELERLTWLGAAARFPDGLPDNIRATLQHELKLIEELGYAAYFLTVHEIVAFARSREILCQGRGSAANSAVCFCLGITSVNPAEVDLLFERFISASRNEPPDIDVDFEHERREEVIQHIYRRYGRERAGLAATVIAYRSRSAIRDVGKALGLSSDTVGILADTVWGSGSGGIDPTHVRAAGLDPADRRLAMALELGRTLCGFPRHLSQHVGGFVIVAGRLDELAPIQNAAMPERTVIEWDKDDLDALGILKIDVLALGMLSCIRRCFALLAQHHHRTVTLADMPRDDPAVYDMLCRADSLGVFQVESRAQMSMLPRLRPRNFYDLTIEVAIVRPGPIQGDMVHPYLQRRTGKEPVTYPSAELERVLGKTMGVPLFQEQAMKIAIVAAGFTPSEADLLRRAMATFRHTGTIHNFRDKMIEGMVARGYQREFAERCFKQIEGFGSYGFPESHAASFALLVYASAWLKCHYPAAFACALLNSQPMGFYAPAQIVRDAREHGVIVLPPDINASDWDCTLEADNATAQVALRLGLRQIAGADQQEMQQLVAQRRSGYRDVADLWRRGGVSRRQIDTLARADAFGSLALARREALWAARGLREDTLPLFAHATGATLSASAAYAPATLADLTTTPQTKVGGKPDGIDSDRAAVMATEIETEPSVVLPTMALGEQVVDDYRSLRLSLRAHPLALLRPQLDRRLVTSRALATLPLHRPVAIIGLVLVRQRPGTASGTVFITLEDETGSANAIVWNHVFERFRLAIMGARLLRIEGRLQREGRLEDGQVIHVVADRLVDCSQLLDGLAGLEAMADSTMAPDTTAANKAGVPSGHGRHGILPAPFAHADEARRGSGDRRQPPLAPTEHGSAIRIASRDFH